MDENTEFKRIQSVIVRIGLFLLGSGVLLNAVFVFGAYYYVGYVSTLGFDSQLFPISRFDSYEWAYSASISTGMQLLPLIASYLIPVCILFGLAVFFFVLLWKKIDFSNHSEESKKTQKGFFVWLRERHPEIYASIKRFVHSERVEEAGRVSERSLYLLLFIVLCITVWTVFPWLGYILGSKVGDRNASYYESNLCVNPNNSWNWCAGYEFEGKQIEGRLLLKNGDLLGVYTSEGPLTVTATDEYRFLRSRLPVIEE